MELYAQIIIINAQLIDSRINQIIISSVMMKTVESEEQIPYQCEKQLGSGSFATVYLAHSKKDYQKYAIKRIILNGLFDQQVCQQIEKLRALKGDHIIEYYDSYKYERQLWIVMRLCESNLRKVMQETQEFSKEEISQIIVQIYNAMKVLNSHNVMHLDLKPQNILVTDKMNLRLCDFGCSQMTNKGSFSHVSFKEVLFGTSLYICPEIKLGEKTGYKASQDVWSFGVIVYELLYGYRPIKNPDIEMRELWDNRKQIKFPRVSPQKKPILVFLKQILEIHPQKRPTWSQVEKKIINLLERSYVQICPLEQAYDRYIATTQMFVLLLRDIYLNQDAHPQFWLKYGKKLKKTILILLYLYSLKFNDIFGYKLDDKISEDQNKELQFISDNAKVELDKQFDQRKRDYPTLTDISFYEEELDDILKSIREEIKEQSHLQWKSFKKIITFCNQAEKLPQPEYFCCSNKFNETNCVYSMMLN